MNAITRIPAAPEVTTFLFDEHEIRVAHLEDGPRFVATDLCKALKLSNPSVSLKALDPDERSKIFLDHPRGEFLVVTEGGLYSLIMRCQRALVKGSTAWRFRKWATGQVLPTIRRTGRYEGEAVPAPLPKPVDPVSYLSDPRNLMQVLGVYAQRTIELEGVVAEQGQALAVAHDTIQEQAITVAAHDRIANADGAHCVTDVAKLLGVKPSALFVYMRNTEANVRWFYKRTKDGDDIGWQERLDAEELVEVPETVRVEKPDGTVRDKLVIKLRVTPLGVTKLARLLVEAKDDHLPTPIDLVHLVRLSRGDMTSRPRAKGAGPGLFD